MPSRKAILNAVIQLLQDGKERTAKEISAELWTTKKLDFNKSDINSVLCREGKKKVVRNNETYTYQLVVDTMEDEGTETHLPHLISRLLVTLGLKSPNNQGNPQPFAKTLPDTQPPPVPKNRPVENHVLVESKPVSPGCKVSAPEPNKILILDFGRVTKQVWRSQVIDGAVIEVELSNLWIARLRRQTFSKGKLKIIVERQAPTREDAVRLLIELPGVAYSLGLGTSQIISLTSHSNQIRISFDKSNTHSNMRSVDHSKSTHSVTQVKVVITNPSKNRRDPYVNNYVKNEHRSASRPVRSLNHLKPKDRIDEAVRVDPSHRMAPNPEVDPVDWFAQRSEVNRKLRHEKYGDTGDCPDHFSSLGICDNSRNCSYCASSGSSYKMRFDD